MVTKKDNKTKPIKAKTGSKQVKESKSNRFLRLGKSRVESVLKAIRILGNCSNRGNYEYSQEQVDVIDTTLTTAIENMYAKFTPSNQEQESFNF